MGIVHEDTDPQQTSNTLVPCFLDPVKTGDENTKRCVDWTGCSCSASREPVCRASRKEGWFSDLARTAHGSALPWIHPDYNAMGSTLQLRQGEWKTASQVHSFEGTGRTEAGSVFLYCVNLNSAVSASFCAAAI